MNLLWSGMTILYLVTVASAKLVDASGKSFPQKPLASAGAAARSVDCMLHKISLDVDLGNTSAHGVSYMVCIPMDGTIGGTRYLASDSTTRKMIAPFTVGEVVRMKMEPVMVDNASESMTSLAGSSAVYRVNDCVRLDGATAVSQGLSSSGTVAQPQQVAMPGPAALTSANRYFTGERRIRLLSVIIEINGFTADYAGDSREAREAWAAQQRAYMDEEYRFSTYGKIGFDQANSRVVTVNLGTRSLATSNCLERGFEITELAADSLNTAEETSIDAVLYYQPEGSTPACGSFGRGTLGICYVGLLSEVNQVSATPPYIISSQTRRRRPWNAGCFIRYQPPTAASRANIGGHELGHHLGLGHAGGNDESRMAAGAVSEYGDSSAVMGNDHDAINSFTPPVRHYLGVIPDSAVMTSAAVATKLRALSLGPNGLADAYLAVAVSCPQCVSRVSGSNSFGGEVWVSFRGDTETCAPEHVPGSTDYRCHLDHTGKLNKVTIHYRHPGLFPQTEKWFWLDVGETYTLPTGGYAVTACDINDDDTAVVAIGTSAAEAVSRCPPRAPPSVPGVRVTFTLAGTVDSFDWWSFRSRLLTLYPRALDAVDENITSASVSVETTLVYDANAGQAAAADAQLIQGTPLSALSASIGQTIEARSATLVSVLSSTLSPPPSPPPVPLQAQDGDNVGLIAAISVTAGIGSILLLLIAILVYRCNRDRQKEARPPTSNVPVPPAIMQRKYSSLHEIAPAHLGAEQNLRESLSPTVNAAALDRARAKRGYQANGQDRV